MRARHEKFGIADIMPARPFDVEQDQLMPGRAGMLANCARIERHRAGVQRIEGDCGTVTLTSGHRLENVDVLLWGTGYTVDLSYFEASQIASIRTLEALTARCCGIVRSRDLPNLYFPGVGLDGIGGRRITAD